jgi:hypothetical protein
VQLFLKGKRGMTQDDYGAGSRRHSEERCRRRELVVVDSFI